MKNQIAWGVVALLIGSAGLSFGSAGDLKTELPAWSGNGFMLITEGHDGTDRVPRFSPDGTEVVFSRSGVLSIAPVQANATVRRVTPIDFRNESSRPDWSRDTNQIVFTETKGMRARLWRIDPDGKNLKRITHHKKKRRTRDYYPAWAPGGQEIVFVRFVYLKKSEMKSSGSDRGPTKSRIGTLSRLNLNSGTVASLTDPEEVLVGMPAIAPNGKSYAFAGQRNSGQRYSNRSNHILILDENGLRELDGEQGRAPEWSPDGKWIAFSSDRDDGLGIYLTPADGKGPVHRMTPDSIIAHHADWSANGRCLVFSVARRADRESNRRAPMYLGVVNVDTEMLASANASRVFKPSSKPIDLKACSGPET